MTASGNTWMAATALVLLTTFLAGCVDPWGASRFAYEIEVHDGSFRMDGKNLNGTMLHTDASDVYVFTNVGTMNHTVTRTDDTYHPSDVELAPGEQVEMPSLDRGSTYTFYCRYHEGMRFHVDVVSISA